MQRNPVRIGSSAEFGDIGTTGKAQKQIPAYVSLRHNTTVARDPRVSVVKLKGTLLFGVQFPLLGCGCRAFDLFLGMFYIHFRERRCHYCR